MNNIVSELICTRTDDELIQARKEMLVSNGVADTVAFSLAVREMIMQTPDKMNKLYGIAVPYSVPCIPGFGYAFDMQAYYCG